MPGDSDDHDDDVVRLFPPLPPPPLALESRDPRQEGTRRILDNLAAGLFGAEEGGGGRANLDTGFPASAPDLGRLQGMLEAPLAHMDMEEVRARWDRDLRLWMERLVLRWVQRVKLMRIELRENGAHVTLETQDDRGHYRFGFDVFPGRAGPAKPQG